MKHWLTVADIIDARLPGVPATSRGVNALAKREDWQHRQDQSGLQLARRRRGKGGGWEYHYTLLPATAQVRLIATDNAKPEAPASTKPTQNWDWYAAQPDKRKETARHRLEVLQAVAALQRGGATKDMAVNQVGRHHKVSPRTIYGWMKLTDGLDPADWLPALAPRHTGRSRAVECDPAAWEALKTVYLRQEGQSFSACFDELKMIAEEQGWTIPSERTLKRRMDAEIPRALKVLMRKGPEALRALYPPQRRYRTDFHAMEAVNVDGHRWDVFVNWPGIDKPVRPMMVAIQDLYSNKILAWRIGLSESADLIRLTFKDLFEEWGIPDYCWLDNGRGFASKAISGGQPNRYRFKVKQEEVCGILTSLNVEVHWTRPYSGQSKPIERAFKDLCDRVAKCAAFAGAYTGNKPDAKPENYGSRAIPLDEFLKWAERGIRLHNAKEGRRTQVCAGVKSFDQVFDESYKIAPIKKANDKHLQMCMLAAESILADRQSGAIKLLGNRYWADFLPNHAGERFTVRFDPDDLHAGVHLYRQDGRYVGFAECLSDTGFADMESGREDAKKRRAYLKKQRELADLETSLSIEEFVELLPDIADEEKPENSVTRLVIGNLAAAADTEPEPQLNEEEELALSHRVSRGLAVFDGGRDD